VDWEGGRDGIGNIRECLRKTLKGMKSVDSIQELDVFQTLEVYE
jgi:hypothetical protein